MPVLGPSDRHIRAALKRLLRAEHRRSRTRIVDEFNLGRAAQVDVAVINSHLAGYEIKSARDSLRRLERQATVYDRTLTKVTLVCTPTHLERATALASPWWGVYVVVPEGSDGLLLTMVRAAQPNPYVDPRSLAGLLWRGELVNCLRGLGSRGNAIQEPRPLLAARLAEALPLQHLVPMVCATLRARPPWKVPW
jgi:hypothetical protein